MAIIQSGATSTTWTIDTTSNSGRVTTYDQYGNPMTDINSLSNILNALNASVIIVLGGQATLGINVSGTTGTLTLNFEATIDNSTWFALSATPVAGGSVTSSTSTDGQWIASTSGYYAVRTRVSAFSVGSMTVSVVVTPNTSKIGAQVVTFPGGVDQGNPNTAANSWPVEVTDGTNVLGTPTHPIRTDPTGSTTQPVSISGTVPVSGTVTSNQGTANSLSNAWTTQITDGTNGPVAVKGASTSPLATDPALVVSISPNSTPNATNTGVVSITNSSTATLGSSATFTGTSESSLSYESITVSVMAIGASAPPGTLIVEQSSDGSNWDIQNSYSVAGGTASPTGEFDIITPLVASNFRIVYTNGSTAQTAFRLQTVKWPIKNSVPDLVQKGVQPGTFLPVQAAKDSGRTIRTFVATATAGVTTEAMMTLTPLTGFVAGGTGTSFTITSGKTLRIQSFVASVRATAATAVAGTVRLRISASGAVTTATAVTATIGLAPTSAVIGSGNGGNISFHDGLELSGTIQIGVSQIMTATSATIDVEIIGYEY